MNKMYNANKEDAMCIFLGNDKRQIYAAEEFVRSGFYAIHLPILQDLDTPEFQNKTIYLIFPIPLTKKVFFEICNANPNEFFESANSKRVKLVGGKIDPEILAAARSHGIFCIDFGEEEAFLIENAYLTSEAAVNIIMQTSSSSIRSIDIALFGYGRISKYLLVLLRSLGARVSVLARREESRVAAKCDGAFDVYSFGEDDVLRALESNDVVINTVPCRIISADILSRSKKKPNIIDLASLPGGIDTDAARQMGYKATRELGLPAKYAPKDAGEIVAKTIMSALF